MSIESCLKRLSFHDKASSLEENGFLFVPNFFYCKIPTQQGAKFKVNMR